MGWSFLPFRRAPRSRRWWRVPVVASAKLDAAGARARIYVCDLGAPADTRILCSSLDAAGLPGPRWLPGSGTAADEDEVRAAFLSGEPVAVPLVAPSAGPDALTRVLAWAQRADIEVDLVPVEVLWGPAQSSPHLHELWLGDPFAPPRWLRWLHVRLGGRCRVIAGVPTTRSELESHAPRSLAAFVRSRAVRALSSQEREIFGERLKRARGLAEELLAQPDFQDRVAAAGAASGLTRQESLGQAQQVLQELATGQRRLALAIFSRLARWGVQLAFHPDISLDPSQLARLRELGRSASLVFLPSHQSRLDPLVLFAVLYSAGFSPPFIAAGMDLSFWPIRPLLRGAGAFFIRRSSADPVYRESLRAFVAGVLQRHFHLAFFPEDMRARSDELSLPRNELLRSSAEAGNEPGAREVWFVPVSLTYDPVLELRESVRPQSRAGRESLLFLLRQIRRARRRRRMGRIHLRLGEPLSLRAHRGHHVGDPLALEKLASEVCARIDAARPLLPASVLCSILLARDRRALTAEELDAEAQRVIDYARERGIEVGGELAAGAAEGVAAALAQLGPSGTVASHAGGIETVFYVPGNKRHTAAYYRNSVLHAFAPRAIAELARAAAVGASSDEEHWALRLRELLELEFSFPEREAFLAGVGREREILSHERSRSLGPFAAGAPAILGPLLEDYRVVAETLAASRTADGLQEADLLERCRGTGLQLRLQGHIAGPEDLSSTAFANALQLVTHLGACEHEGGSITVRDRAALQSLADDLERLTTLARA